MSANDTIFALATASGRSGLAVFRVSGPYAKSVLERLAGPAPSPRRAVLRTLRAASGETLDEGLVLWFPGPESYTGEDVAELHVHGGTSVVGAVSDALSAAGARVARAGEFTRRAFAHGKLDLTQAEAIADLVEAETKAQRDQALRQMRGELGALYDGWRDRLVRALAAVEAEIDFPDEGDVPGGLAARAGAELGDLAEAMRAHLNDGRRGERVREGFHVALIGAPNVGKSTLLNRLSGRDAAIVTDIPGTTRDIVEARLVLNGHLVIFADTAGLRDSDDVVEREGVRRARARAEDADLRVLVLDATRPEAAHELRTGDLAWINKTDAAEPDAARRTLADAHRGLTFAGAARTGLGVGDLKSAIAGAASAVLGSSESPSLTRARHRDAVARAAGGVERALDRFADAPELAGEDLRLAARALGEVTGRVDVEEILDRIFADFCIGK